MLLAVPAGAIPVFTDLVLANRPGAFLRVDRTGVAIVDATAMGAFGVIPLDDADDHIDFRRLILLFAMMVLIARYR